MEHLDGDTGPVMGKPGGFVDKAKFLFFLLICPVGKLFDNEV